MLPRMSVRSLQFVVSFHNSFRDGVKTLLGAFFRSTREDVGSVCLHISSMSTFRIVSFRGEGLPVFFVRSSVRSTPTQRVLYRFNAQHFLCVQLCVGIVCRCVCVYVLCCMQRTPTEHVSSMCMCSVLRSRQTPTAEPVRAETHRCYYHEQDATEI